MTREEFAQRIKQKYPSGVSSDGIKYAEMDNDELAERVMAAYPIYRGQVEEKSTFRKIGDFFTSSTQKFGETIGTALSVSDKEVVQNRKQALESQNQAENNLQLLIKKAQTQSPDEAKRTLEQVKRLGQEQNIDIFNNSEYQKTAKQVFGEAAGTFLELAAFSSAGKAPGLVKNLTTGGKILKSAGQGAAIGGGFGAGFGASEAMQQNKSAGDIAKQAITSGAIGAAGGAVLGGGLSAAGAGVSALAGKAQRLQPIIRNKIGEAAYNKLTQVSRNLLKMSPGVTKNEAKWNKNTPKFLVDEGIIPLIESDGNKISTEAARLSLKEKYIVESNAFNRLLADSGEYISLNQLRTNSLKGLSEFKTRGSDLEKAKKYVLKEIESYKQNYKDIGIIQGDDMLLPAIEFNKIKSGLWSKTSNFNPTMADKLLSDINYRMGHQAKDIIEDSIEDVAIKRFNSRLGDFISSLKILENANGKVLPGGFFTKQFTRLAGTVAGSSGGIPGSIIGNLTGGALADLAMNPKIKTGTLAKVLKMLEKTPKGQSMVDEAERILLKRGEERAARKLIEAPKTIFSGGKTSESGLLSQEEIAEIKKVGGLFEFNERVRKGKLAAGLKKKK